MPRYIPSVISLEEGLELNVEELKGLESPPEPEDPNSLVATEIFSCLRPGNERVCVVLRAEGLTYKSIGEIMGLSEVQIKNTIYGIRKRIKDQLGKRQ